MGHEHAPPVVTVPWNVGGLAQFSPGIDSTNAGGIK